MRKAAVNWGVSGERVAAGECSPVTFDVENGCSMLDSAGPVYGMTRIEAVKLRDGRRDVGRCFTRTGDGTRQMQVAAREVTAHPWTYGRFGGALSPPEPHCIVARTLQLAPFGLASGRLGSSAATSPSLNTPASGSSHRSNVGFFGP